MQNVTSPLPSKPLELAGHDAICPQATREVTGSRCSQRQGIYLVYNCADADGAGIFSHAGREHIKYPNAAVS